MLTSRLEAETRVKERYKRRWLRLKVRAAEPERQDVGSVSSASLPEEPQAGPPHSVGAMSTPVCISTPRSKTRALLRSVGSVGKVPCSVKKTLLYHNFLISIKIFVCLVFVTVCVKCLDFMRTVLPTP